MKRNLLISLQRLFNDHKNKNDVRQYLFNNDYISNSLLKWISDIIIILRTSLTMICNKNIIKIDSQNIKKQHNHLTMVP
jgi:hypothetical protein